MAKIQITTSDEEQAAVLQAVSLLTNTTVSVATIASKAGIAPSRARYVLLDLEESGKIKRIPTQAFNKHYIRYKYELVAQS